jgi:hypothetical protein
LRISAPAAKWPGPMSHLNAVTVLLAAFATRGSKLKAEANQADLNIPQRFRDVP